MKMDIIYKICKGFAIGSVYLISMFAFIHYMFKIFVFSQKGKLSSDDAADFVP
jgi:Na+/H+-translocating membrane pyrophosphatase